MQKASYKYRAYSPYSFGNFLLDCLMVIVTCGLWIIWILIREGRKL